MKTIGIIIALILGYEINDNLRQEREIREYCEFYKEHPMSTCTYFDSLESVTDTIIIDTIK